MKIKIYDHKLKFYKANRKTNKLDLKVDGIPRIGLRAGDTLELSHHSVNVSIFSLIFSAILDEEATIESSNYLK